jgi:SagB-type dehydrogenase family enzyme
MEETMSIERIKLPKVNYDGPISVEKALFKRRSIRRYKNESLNLDEVSQLLWAAQGITDERGFRTAPSAGALYPLVVYLAIGNVEDLTPGLYKYKPHEHELIKVKEGDIISEIFNAALGQTCVKNGSIDIVFSAVYQKTTQKYGERGERYVHMEVGHAAQNDIYRQLP